MSEDAERGMQEEKRLLRERIPPVVGEGEKEAHARHLNNNQRSLTHIYTRVHTLARNQRWVLRGVSLGRAW